jgi:hypothetical protein
MVIMANGNEWSTIPSANNEGYTYSEQNKNCIQTASVNYPPEGCTPLFISAIMVPSKVICEERYSRPGRDVVDKNRDSDPGPTHHQ